MKFQLKRVNFKKRRNFNKNYFMATHSTKNVTAVGLFFFFTT